MHIVGLGIVCSCM